LKTQKLQQKEGMDLNPLFTSATTFRPSFSNTSTISGGELSLFLLTGIPLVHGWLVDPDSPTAHAMAEENAEDYDSAVALIAEADHLTGGLLVEDINVEGNSRSGDNDRSNESERRGLRRNWTEEGRRKVHNGEYIF
jgi:ubiquitin carboxyl-terminal hydrolase MINDY-1/2